MLSGIFLVNCQVCGHSCNVEGGCNLVSTAARLFLSADVTMAGSELVTILFGAAFEECVEGEAVSGFQNQAIQLLAKELHILVVGLIGADRGAVGTQSFRKASVDIQLFRNDIFQRNGYFLAVTCCFQLAPGLCQVEGVAAGTGGYIAGNRVLHRFNSIHVELLIDCINVQRLREIR